MSLSFQLPQLSQGFEKQRLHDMQYVKSVVIAYGACFVGGNNLLSLLGSVIVNVCNNPVKYSDLQLQTAASLALSKFMLVR